MGRLTKLQNELVELNSKIETYKKSCRGDQLQFDINKVINRKTKVYIKINQEHQKSLTLN